MAKFPSKQRYKKTGAISNARATKSELLLLGAIGGLTGEALVGAILVSRFLMDFFRNRKNSSNENEESKKTEKLIQTPKPKEQPILQKQIPSIPFEEPKEDLDPDSEFFKNLNKKINDPKEANTSFFKDINKLLENKDQDIKLKDIEKVLHIHTRLLQNIDLNTKNFDKDIKKLIPSELDTDTELIKARRGEFLNRTNVTLPKDIEQVKTNKKEESKTTSPLVRGFEQGLGSTLTGWGLKGAVGLVKKVLSTGFIGELAEGAGGLIIGAITSPATIGVLGAALLTYFLGPKAKALFDKIAEPAIEHKLATNLTSTIRDRINKGEKIEDIKADLIAKGKELEEKNTDIPKGSTEKEINDAINQVYRPGLPSKENNTQSQSNITPQGPNPWTPPQGLNTIPLDLSNINSNTPQVQPVPNTNLLPSDQLASTVIPPTPQTQIQNSQINQQNSPALDLSAFPVKPLQTPENLDVSAYKVKPLEIPPTTQNIDASKIKYKLGTIPPEIAELAIETEKQTGVPARLTLPQWAVESAWGTHTIYNTNPFGISWPYHGQGATAGDFKDTTEDLTQKEYISILKNPNVRNVQKWEEAKPSAKDPNKKKIKLQKRFANFPTLKDAFIAHAKILSNPKGNFAERFNKFKQTGDLPQFINDISSAPTNPQPGHDYGAYGTDTQMPDTLKKLSSSSKVSNALEMIKNEQPVLLAQNQNVELMKRNPETGVAVHASSLNNDLNKTVSNKPIVVPVPTPVQNGGGTTSTSNVIVPAPVRNSDDTYKDANLLSWRNT